MNRFTLQSKKNISRGATALLVFLLFALFAFSFYAELIPVNDGAGFDGAFYREVFRNFSTDFFTSGYDSFRIQRIFPFCLLNVVYGLAGIPLDNAHMIAGMYVLHFVNLALQLLFFFKLAKLQGWNPVTKVILFALFFFNFATLKNCGYVPFQTDAFAVTIALASYYMFLRGKSAIALAMSLLGLVTWPTLTYVMALLILFPQRTDKTAFEPSYTGFSGTIRAKFFRLLPFAYVIPAIGMISLSYTLHKLTTLHNLLLADHSLAHITLSLIAFVALGWFIAAHQKVPGLPYSAKDFSRSFSPRAFIAVSLCIATITLFLRLHTNDVFFFDCKTFLLQVFARPLKYPLITFVGHFVYWGLLPVLLIIFAKDFVKNFTEKSPGHALALLFFLFLSIDSESRHIAPFLPILLVFLGSALDKANLAPKAAIFTVVTQLVLSHFYITINVDGFAESLEQGNFFSPVAQRFFMNYGPWMTGISYFYWIAINFVTIIGANEVFRHAKRPQSDL